MDAQRVGIAVAAAMIAAGAWGAAQAKKGTCSAVVSGVTQGGEARCTASLKSDDPMGKTWALRLDVPGGVVFVRFPALPSAGAFPGSEGASVGGEISDGKTGVVYTVRAGKRAEEARVAVGSAELKLVGVGAPEKKVGHFRAQAQGSFKAELVGTNLKAIETKPKPITVEVTFDAD